MGSRSSKPAVHQRCRGAYPAEGAPARLVIPDRAVPWAKPYPAYEPPAYIHPNVAKKPFWADDVAAVASLPYNEIDTKKNVDRRSFTGRYSVDANGFPLNPRGRTGMRERGLLGRYGPNHAADPIVTRWRRNARGEIARNAAGKKIAEVIVVKRRDNGLWALPGGMVDPGEVATATLKREFGEEALNSLEMDDDKRAELAQRLDKLFHSGRVVFEGYVDDPRNTDNAWMETTAIHIHDEDGTAFNEMQLSAGDDAGDVKWAEISPEMELYADHMKYIREVYSHLLRTSK